MRKQLLLFLLMALLLTFGTVEAQEHQLVDLAQVNPRIIIELKYATTDNFLKQKIYTDNTCYVLGILANKLDQAQKLLEQDGLGLKVYDGYRSVEAQKKMWAICPDPRYVANPYKGGSNHCRGAAVDLTIIDKDGNEMEMPTPFDTFAERAHQYSLAPTSQQRLNRMLLRTVMKQVGLQSIRTEWWHYQLPNANKYPIINKGGF
ncbi:MAG TPA: D-alanyl-D-alanine dipeptidase [Bacillota bacterium]|jgi:D-alanyl-D-alanine dipeptidase|nr:D-alanyl-D-alanine dipeptidase [Bacillota bacterium]HOL11050.1 D-alanyl-D-alanine dipeptidase [Bacillota bacterium]HPO98813.1 D-alanyl-D-alanine dipeptidase [Bacillota bacterium]